MRHPRKLGGKNLRVGAYGDVAVATLLARMMASEKPKSGNPSESTRHMGQWKSLVSSNDDDDDHEVLLRAGVVVHESGRSEIISAKLDLFNLAAKAETADVREVVAPSWPWPIDVGKARSNRSCQLAHFVHKVAARMVTEYDVQAAERMASHCICNLWRSCMCAWQWVWRP